MKALFCLALLLHLAAAAPAVGSPQVDAVLARTSMIPDLAVVLGLPAPNQPGFVTDLAKQSALTLYFHSQDPAEVGQVRAQAEAAGLLGSRIFADIGSWTRIPLADNLAGLVVVSASAEGVPRSEVLRVLYPNGRALMGGQEVTKPVPAGWDDWSHPYHGPDNNPQSEDDLARAPFLTQFIADPKFSPMPEVSVISGGRLFKAFGHIAHKANQNAVLNTLMGINAHNGIKLWQRPLREGFMIHRNTLVATPEVLYIADHLSCQMLDPLTGKTLDEIVIPEGVGDGPVWKWMALQDGVLYALVGAQEAPIRTVKSDNPALGHWPWGMWDGHDYKDAKQNFGSGRTFVAIDPKTKKILWQQQETEYIDSRGVCMYQGRVYFYSPEQFLACLDAKTGGVLWRNGDTELLEAIGPNSRAQHYVTGYATTTYIKCNDGHIFFAGPQRERLVVASSNDGHLLWQNPNGNLQLVLRDDGFYAAGPNTTGAKFDFTGQILAELPQRRACTRATGSKDSIFFRTPGGTVRVDTSSNTAKHIAPMRPPCQDGVIIANGQLYWGPWMCGCQLSLYGNISLTAAGDFDFAPTADSTRLEVGSEGPKELRPFPVHAQDWPAYRHDSQLTSATDARLPSKATRAWTFKSGSPSLPTAPVAAGDTLFFGDLNGVVHAVNADGKARWKAYTGGAIYFPPVVHQDRLFVGSADGRVYAFEAASGKLLWRFRVGAEERRIPVYGKLVSTWPVAGGVVVDQNTVYAAAGIAHYDGTHVVALDARTGAVKWYNNSSGMLSEKVDSGVSLQGELSIEAGELRFAGGGIYQVARYDLATGRCLNEPHHQPTSRYQTACYAYYPDYGQYLSLDHTFKDGRTLSYTASYEGSRHTALALLAPAPAGNNAPPLDPQTARRSPPQGKAPKREAVWSKEGDRYQSWVVAGDRLLAVGQTGVENTQDPTSQPFLCAIQVKDGAELWRMTLPRPAVKGGVAIDHRGRIFLTLQDGQLICFNPVQHLGKTAF